jgi:hypothetical protein
MPRRRTKKAQKPKSPKREMVSANTVLRFSITPVGPARDESTIVAEVEAARREALKGFKTGKERAKKVEATAEPEGGFLAGGLEWIWLLHVAHVASPYLIKAGEGLAAGIGTETAKLLFRRFSSALSKRNIKVSEPKVASSTVSTGTVSGKKSKGKQKNKKAAR